MALSGLSCLTYESGNLSLAATNAEA